jgi:hypothetical protein
MSGATSLPGYNKMCVTIAPDAFNELGMMFIETMNLAQQLGHPIDHVIAAAMYSIGGAVAQRGGVLDLDAPLRDALPSVVRGYLVAIRERQQS